MRIDHTEKTLIENALKLFGDDVNGKKIAAKSLGISLTTLYRKIKLYNIA
jgi:transcriptional regulator with PAS, ATPase and Fis domain